MGNIDYKEPIPPFSDQLIINFNSSGLLYIRRLTSMVLIHTLFPEPVAPAINPCGIFCKSVTIGFPEISKT